MTSRIDHLVQEIKKHNKAYWIDNNPSISDADYDKLVRQLAELDPDNSILNEIHTPKVLANGKIKFVKPMLSLDKVYSVEDLLKWCEKVARDDAEKFKIEPKYDGVSALLESGILATRGDGEVGENISDKLPIIKIVTDPYWEPKLGTEFKENCRGEIIILKKDFDEVKSKVPRKSGEEYKNTRNAVGGILNRDDIDPSIGPILTLVDFDAVVVIKTLHELKTKFEWEEFIKATENSEFPADGLVIKIADSEYAEKLGITSHHSKAEMSLKFVNPSAQTELLSVLWSVGKNSITPIGKVAPVEIGGVTVSNVNLHNYRNIVDKRIHIGDTLVIERAGDVIPYVKESISGNVQYLISIDICPECGENVEFKDPEIICPNDNCPGKNQTKLMDSIIRIGIEGLGLPTLKKMISTLNVRSLIDVLNLKVSDIMLMEGFARSSSVKLFEEIQRVKTEGVTEWQILSSLNLHGIGTRFSKTLLNNVSLSELRLMSEDDLISFNGISSKRAEVIVQGLKSNSEYIDQLMNVFDNIKQVDTSKFAEPIKRVCLTGKFPEKKAYYEDLLKQRGWLAESSVKKGLDFLVCDDLKGSGKQKKAEKLGIPIITSKELLERLQN